MLITLKNEYRLPARLARVRRCVGLFFKKLVSRYLKSFKTARLQRGFDETFRRMAESTTWEVVCRGVFGQYLGQLSFTPVKQIRLLVEKLHIGSKSHVLDLACGTGGLSLYLAKLAGCRLAGVDISPVAVKIANEQAMLQGLSHRVNFEVGVLPDLPYQDDFFDAIVSIDSVYGIPEKAVLFRGCCRVLRPGGSLGFYTLYRRREFFGGTALHARASFWFPSRPYPNLLEEAGFKGVSRMDLTEDFVRLGREWVRAMQDNRVALKREMGEKRVEGLLADIGTAWALAKEGCVGRGLFRARKPV